MFTGAMTALVTPFRETRDGGVDDAALAQLIEAQILAGIDGLIPCGTTGEAPTLEPEEHAHVVRVTVEAARKRVPVIAGTGANSTAHTIALSKAAHAAGADGLLVVTPYYNRPTQEGLVRHYKAIAEAVPLPLIVYNIPGRTGGDLTNDTFFRLVSDVPRVVGLKDAAGSPARAQEAVRRLGDRVAVLSGDDALNLAFYAVGARGCISVASNVIPKLVAGVWDAAAAGDFVKAREIHFKTLAISDALFVETSPQPVKAALHMMGMIGPGITPLYAMSGPARERLRAVLAEHGLV